MSCDPEDIHLVKNCDPADAASITREGLEDMVITRLAEHITLYGDGSTRPLGVITSKGPAAAAPADAISMVSVDNLMRRYIPFRGRRRWHASLDALDELRKRYRSYTYQTGDEPITFLGLPVVLDPAAKGIELRELPLPESEYRVFSGAPRQNGASMRAAHARVFDEIKDPAPMAEQDRLVSLTVALTPEHHGEREVIES